MKVKTTDVFTKAQIQGLCDSLKHASEDAYSSRGRTFMPNTHIPTYDILADEINSNNKGVIISASWLRNLFIEYTKKPISNISSSHLDSVCQYLKGLNSKEYFDWVYQNIIQIFGVYDVYWKGTTDFNDKTKTGFDYIPHCVSFCAKDWKLCVIRDLISVLVFGQ